MLRDVITRHRNQILEDRGGLEPVFEQGVKEFIDARVVTPSEM